MENRFNNECFVCSELAEGHHSCDMRVVGGASRMDCGSVVKCMNNPL